MLRRFAAGAGPAEIAAALHLSYGTVRNYLASAVTKLGARNRGRGPDRRRSRLAVAGPGGGLADRGSAGFPICRTARPARCDSQQCLMPPARSLAPEARQD